MKIKRIIGNKKFQLAFLIVCILTLAFFWGGNNDIVPLEEASKDAGVVEDSTKNELTDESENKEEVDAKKDEDEEKDKQEQEEKAKEENAKEEKIAEKKKEEIKKKEEQVKEVKKQEVIKEQKVEKSKIIAEDNKNTAKKDKYHTDPVPVGKPQPKEWQEAKVDKQKELTATLSITSKSILNNMDLFNMDKIDVLPKDGIIYSTQTVKFYEGESVFDVLLRETQKNKIHMEFSMTPIYNSNYIEGINNLYEFDTGELSGWMYRVNGWFPNYGCSRYELQDGDKIEWIYTCDLGRDIGGGTAAMGGS